MAIIFLVLIFIIIYNMNKLQMNGFFNEEKLKKCFSNFQKVYTTSSMTLYKGDRSGENFLLAVKFSSTPISKLDISTIYDVSKKQHIHNKILVTYENINSDSALNKMLKESEIQILSSSDLQNLLSNSKTSSVLQTSDTSDDNCEIEESTNPIQYNKDYGLFSFFKNKPDRL